MGIPYAMGQVGRGALPSGGKGQAGRKPPPLLPVGRIRQEGNPTGPRHPIPWLQNVPSMHQEEEQGWGLVVGTPTTRRFSCFN